MKAKSIVDCEFSGCGFCACDICALDGKPCDTSGDCENGGTYCRYFPQPVAAALGCALCDADLCPRREKPLAI